MKPIADSSPHPGVAGRTSCTSRTLTLGLCLSLLLLTAIGARSSLAMSSSSWSLLYAGDFDWHSRLDRLRVARDLDQRVQQLSQRIPDQAPDETARLRGQETRLRNADPQARSRLFLSPAYQHRELRRTLREISAALDCVIGASTLPLEISCWSSAAVALLKEEQMSLALETLRRARRLPRKRDTPVVERDPDLWYAQFGRGIIAYILDPYLNRESVSNNAGSPLP